MNARIEELKHLASVWCDENIPEQFSEETLGYGKAWENKFAELIIKECFDVVIKDGRFHDAKGIIRAGKSVAMEHFGVKL